MDTSARLLRLLSLFQARRDWSGTELAERLDVSGRTIRRDIERLRDLGYPVEARRGSAGYRLGAGAALPPLLLDDDEAVAVAVGLRTAAGYAVTGIDETSVRALVKLEQVLPSRLRRRVNALQTFTVALPGAGPTVAPDVLTNIAAACRDHERLRFDYRSAQDVASVRVVEPHRVVHTGRRWYLLAWDVDRDDWRIFRVDRIGLRQPTGPRFTPRDLPDGDAAAYVARRLATAPWTHRAKVLVHASADDVGPRMWPGLGVVEPVDAATCVIDIGAQSVHELAVHIALLDVDFEVDEPPELVEHLATLSERYRRAVHR